LNLILGCVPDLRTSRRVQKIMAPHCKPNYVVGARNRDVVPLSYTFDPSLLDKHLNVVGYFLWRVIAL
jgi:hypothetical protein